MRAKVVTVMRWYAQDEVNQEDSEQNEVDGMKKEGSWFHRWGDAYVKERLVICLSHSHTTLSELQNDIE